jgi:hypothetical protein
VEVIELLEPAVLEVITKYFAGEAPATETVTSTAAVLALIFVCISAATSASVAVSATAAAKGSVVIAVPPIVRVMVSVPARAIAIVSAAVLLSASAPVRVEAVGAVITIEWVPASLPSAVPLPAMLSMPAPGVERAAVGAAAKEGVAPIITTITAIAVMLMKENIFFINFLLFYLFLFYYFRQHAYLIDHTIWVFARK